MLPPDRKKLQVSPEPAAVITIPDQVLTLINGHGKSVIVGPDTDVRRYSDPAATRLTTDGYLPPDQSRTGDAASTWVRQELMDGFTWDRANGKGTHRGIVGLRFVDSTAGRSSWQAGRQSRQCPGPGSPDHYGQDPATGNGTRSRCRWPRTRDWAG